MKAITMQNTFRKSPNKKGDISIVWNYRINYPFYLLLLLFSPLILSVFINFCLLCFLKPAFPADVGVLRLFLWQ